MDAKERAMVTDVVRTGDTGNVTEHNTALKSTDEEVPSLTPQLQSENDRTHTNQLDSPCCSRVLKRQRMTVRNLPASMNNVDSCSLEIISSTAANRENIICKHSKRVKTAPKLKQQQLSTGTYKCPELDVLLTPLSEGRLMSLTRPHRPVAESASPFLVDSTSPESTALTPKPKAAKLSKPCASIPPGLSNSSELLNGDVEPDVVESTVPNSTTDGGSCSLIPLQFLLHKNALVDDDTEIDVFIRSFWDEESDPESLDNSSPVVDSRSPQVSDVFRVGNSLKLKPKAASKQKRKAGKRKIARSAKTTRSMQQSVASSAVSRNSKKHRSRAESNCCKSPDSNQKGTETDGSSLVQRFAMTLRPRKKAKVGDVGCNSLLSCKVHLCCLQTKTLAYTHNEKRRSSKIQRQTKNKHKQPSQKVYTKVAPVAASNKAVRRCGRSYSKSTSPLLSSKTRDHQVASIAARKRGRSQRRKSSSLSLRTTDHRLAPVASRKCHCHYSKSASPLLSSRTSDHRDQPSGQTGRKSRASQKRRQPSRKCTRNDVSTRPLCKKATVAESIKPFEDQANDDAPVSCGNILRAVHSTAAQAVTRGASQQSKTTRSTSKSCSNKQFMNKCATDKQETKVRRGAASLTEDRENTEVAAPKLLQSCRVECVDDAGSSSSVKGKKTRFVDMSLLHTTHLKVMLNVKRITFLLVFGNQLLVKLLKHNQNYYLKI